MKDRKAIKRALEKAGFTHLRPGWVREEGAAAVQGVIDAAVSAAADEVQAIREGLERK